MKKQETINVMTYASALWSTFKLPQDDKQCQAVMSVWFDTLKDFELPVIKSAMLDLSKESDFCTIGKILRNCETIQKLALGELVDSDEIVNKIIKAVGSVDKRAEFEKLPAPAKKIVGSPAQLYKWAKLDGGTFHTVVVSQLKKSAEKQIDTQNKIDIIEKQDLKQVIEKSRTEMLEFKE